LTIILSLFLAQPGTGLCATSAKEPAEPIVQKTRTEISFSLATEQQPAKGLTFGLTRVQKNGREFPAPSNMKLDPKTGAFSWLPTESQAGVYEVAFLIKDAAGKESRTTRRITVEPREIVPPRDNSKIAKLLRKWYKEGTAAGNTGDFYDNRDGGHSRLNTRRFPQLDKVEYTEEQKKRRLHWAVQLRLLFNHVTLGNSSTASGDLCWGSNSRRCLLSPRAMQALYRQYTRNHLYIYPEHRDHDPGHNGRGGGYGDLFPANTPYVITCQGSSGADRPFVEAVAYTLAAFRPGVKKDLIDSGLLMPTVQMIFRTCNKNIKAPEDYLTGKAHPTAFEAKNVDPLKMVQMAHAMRRDAIPPMIQLAVVEEDVALPGRDYFDVGERERPFETPAAIARIVRSTKCVRRMVVSAKRSYDINDRPLKYHWVVLRGDAGRIKINRLNKEGSAVELLVPYHERRPIHPGARMESSRVDIGAFVHNGAYYSAPGFICFYSLDNEARTYAADGRILEVSYDYGDSTIGYHTQRLRARDKGYDITDWPALLEFLRDDKKGFPAALLRKQFTSEELSALHEAAKELEAACAGEKEPKKEYDDAEAARKKARAAVNEAKKKLSEAKKAHANKPTDATKTPVEEAEAKLKTLQDKQKKADQRHRAARRKLDKAQRAARRVLTTTRPRLAASVKVRLERALNDIKNDADFYFKNAKAIQDIASKDASRKKALVNARTDLVKQGILRAEGEGRFSLSPIIEGSNPAAERLTKYERNRLEWFNIAILQNVLYPGLLSRRYRRNFVNPLIATPKTWRDVYHYDANGRLIGWTRYEEGEKKEFTADGALIVKNDRLGRALEARMVKYVIERDSRKRPRALKQQPGDTILYYQYDSDEDRAGRIHKREKARKQ